MPFIKRTRTTYVGIIGSTFRLPAKQGDLGAVKRNVIDKASGTVSSVKYEFVEEELMCYIDGLTVKPGRFGDQLLITCHDDEDTFIIQLGMNSKYASNFLKRIPNVDPSKYVVMSPYSIANTDGFTNQGIVIYQCGQKIVNHYADANKKPINGIPTLTDAEAEEHTGDSAFWTYWYTKLDKFMLDKALTIDFSIPKTDSIPVVYQDSADVSKPNATPKDTLKMYEQSTKTEPEVDYKPNGADIPPLRYDDSGNVITDDLPF